jgi:hypothetical protein
MQQPFKPPKCKIIWQSEITSFYAKESAKEFWSPLLREIRPSASSMQHFSACVCPHPEKAMETNVALSLILHFCGLPSFNICIKYSTNASLLFHVSIISIVKFIEH